MKVSKEKAAEHRAAILDAAGRLFREHGFDGVGVAQVMKAAGLTHGGFYGHFQSKDALAAEVCGTVFTGALERLAKVGVMPGHTVDGYLDRYFSKAHRDHGESGCPMVALSTDVSRQDDAVRQSFSKGVEDFISLLVERLPATPQIDAAERRARAIALLSAMIGAQTLARATAASSPALSAEILAAGRAQIYRNLWPAPQG